MDFPLIVNSLIIKRIESYWKYTFLTRSDTEVSTS